MKKFILPCLVVTTMVTVQGHVVGQVNPAAEKSTASAPAQTPSPSKSVADAL